MIGKFTSFILRHKWIAYLLGIFILIGGVLSNPFHVGEETPFSKTSIRLSAIPDLGENQQVISTSWAGHSAEEVEEYITSPLSASLMGMRGLDRVRSSSMEGLSIIYLIFKEEVSVQLARQQITQSLFSLPGNTLPTNVSPALGPESTPLGQIFSYTLEITDAEGNSSIGWDLNEIRNYQDFYLKPELEGVPGVAEVASAGGYLGEYQVILNPRKAHLYQVSIGEVLKALKAVGEEVSMGEIASNGIRYSLHFDGNIHQLSDLEDLPLPTKGGRVLRLGEVAEVQLAPIKRRGALDNKGHEVVGGMVYMQEGEQALLVISAIEDKIKQLSPSLPQKTLENGQEVSLSISSYYNVSSLIQEVLGTLSHTLKLEIIISLLVILLALRSLKLSITVSLLLPLSILFCFFLMNLQGMEAHLLSLAGIALAIGSVVDMGIMLGEHATRNIREGKGQDHEEAIISAVSTTGPALLTSLGTTVLSFLPILMLQHAEGKMFGPLALTKTYLLLGSVLCSFILLPVALALLWQPKVKWKVAKGVFTRQNFLIGLGLVGVCFHWHSLFLIMAGLLSGKKVSIRRGEHKVILPLHLLGLGLFLFLQLSRMWYPLGYTIGSTPNFLLVTLSVMAYFGLLFLIHERYEHVLDRLIQNPGIVWQSMIGIVSLAILSWGGVKPIQKIFPSLSENSFYHSLTSWFPGLSKGYLPQLNEGAFLYMPSSATHIAFSENLEGMKQLDQQLAAIPEVETVVGKLGRANSALDPAPISMLETVINIKPEYISDTEGRPIKVKVDDTGKPLVDAYGNYQHSFTGKYVRLWRSHIHSEQDIWDEIQQIKGIGISRSPKLYPIESRQIMQLSGVNTHLALLIKGDNLDSLDKSAQLLEKFLQEVPVVEPSSVYRHSLKGLPYLYLTADKRALRTHGISMGEFQQILEVYLTGVVAGNSRENRVNYPIRLQIGREYREDAAQLAQLPLVLPSGKSVRLGELATISYKPGPVMIKGENSFMATYLTFEQVKGVSLDECAEEVEKMIKGHLDSRHLLLAGSSKVELIGTYQQQITAENRLAFIVPICVFLILLLLYAKFRSVAEVGMLSMGILLSCCGGVLFLAFWQLPLANMSIFGGISMVEALQLPSIELGIAGWIGFIALIGIAVDDGVILLTYIKEETSKLTNTSNEAFRQAVISAGKLRIKPCLMTTATTVLALFPILTSSGKGAEIMKPITLPLMGGMLIEVCTLFLIPVLYIYWKEKKQSL